MANMFALILVIATLVTGILWCVFQSVCSAALKVY